MSRDAPQAGHLTWVEVDFVRRRVRTAGNFAAVMGFALAGEGEDVDLAVAAPRALEHIAARARARVQADFAAILRGRLGRLDAPLLRSDGSERTLESVWSVEADAAGKPLRAVATLLDATASGRTEQTLRESEARYRSALIAGRMGSWETDLVARTRTWSEEGMALFGLALPGGRGQVGTESDEYYLALHPEDRHLVAHFHRLADQRDSFPAEYRIVRPDGTMLWLAGRGLVVTRTPDGRAHRLVSIMADVTESRQAGEHLRIERERLAQAFTAAQMGAYDLDIDADVLWWAPQMYAVFGVRAETFEPTRESVAALLHPDDLPAFLRLRAEAIAQRRPFVHEFRIVRPDGNVAWIGHLGHAEYDAQGRPVRSFGVAMDITERKQVEQALRDADRMKDNFIATLAHELRNPLAPIRNAANLLHATGGSDPQVAWCRDVIERQVAQMAHLLDDLLDVARLTRGQIQLRREPLELARVIEQALEIVQPMIAAAGHRLTVTLPQHPVRLEGDLTRLTQVFSNLLINAAKYTQARGCIELRAQEDGDSVEVSVTDNGIGIGAEQMPHIFRMFGQAEAALTRAQGGVGIGLSLAKGLVEKHGGTIGAHSEGHGKGARFVVRLPVDRTPHAAPVPPAQHPLARQDNTTYRILIADDLRDSADSLAKLLEAMGHQVRVAYSGEQALQAAASFRPEVVLLDLGMPGLDGYETCRRLRAQPWGGGLTLIAQTGWGQEQDRRRTLDAGFDHHIVKPIDAPSLLALLQRGQVLPLASPQAKGKT